jgi:hypothetical protein
MVRVYGCLATDAFSLDVTNKPQMRLYYIEVMLERWYVDSLFASVSAGRMMILSHSILVILLLDDSWRDEEEEDQAEK